MKRIFVVLIIASAIMVCLGCGKTKTVNVHSEKKTVTGQQMTCVYHYNNLYCGSELVTAEEIDKRQMMMRVVPLVSQEEKKSDLKEGGAFSTKFATNPKAYSVWNCSNTGEADPAVKCTLLREADPKLVAQQEQEIKLNETQEAKLQTSITEQNLPALCGSPIERKNDSISRTYYYPSSHSGVLVEVRFDTIRQTKLDGLTTVDAKTHAFYVDGILWHNYIDIGSTEEDRVPPIRDYFPCILKN